VGIFLKRTLTSVSVILLLGTGVTSTPQVKAEKSISILEDEVNETKIALRALREQIKKIDQAISDNQAMITETEKGIAEGQKERKNLIREIGTLEERIQARKEILEGRARTIQENGGDSYLDVVLEAESIGDFLNRVNAVTTIIQADKGLMDEHDDDVRELKEKQRAVDEKLASLRDKKTELDGMRKQIEEQRVQQDALKRSLQRKQRDKEHEIEERAKPMNASEGKKVSLPRESIKDDDTPLPPAPSKPSGSVSTVVSAGYRYIGNSVYVFGGGRNAYDVANGRFDCSGFVHWAFSQAGFSVGSSTDSLKHQGVSVSVSQMRPGDLVFFDTYKKDGHVGIYVGGGKFIGSQSNTGVAVASMTSGYWKNTFNGRVKRLF
jgi:peptidoglycan DL-endopeptidase CwlO